MVSSLHTISATQIKFVPTNTEVVDTDTRCGLFKMQIAYNLRAHQIAKEAGADFLSLRLNGHVLNRNDDDSDEDVFTKASERR